MSEEIAEKQEQQRKYAMLVDYAQLSRLIVSDLNKSNKPMTVFKKYTKEDVRKFLENPQVNEPRLREISNFLYHNSMNYKRLIRYFSTSLLFDYVLEPYGIDEKVSPKTLKNNFLKTSNFVDNLNLKHEFQKVLNVSFKEDIFYGYEFLTPDSYYILKLDPKYCKVSGVEDGCLTFSFNFSYFDSADGKDTLGRFPAEFKTKYERYQGDKKSYKWIELDSENTICIKIEEDVEYAIPPFAGVFEDVFDIVDYKALRKNKEEIGNYKVLAQQIPMKQDSEEVNDFLIDLNTVIDFHNKAAAALPDQVGLVTSPMKFSEFSFEKDKVGSDSVAEAQRNYWDSAGVSQLLFNSDKNGSIGLNRSIENDSAFLFAILRQLERWTNRKLKMIGGFATKFRVKFLDITVYNRTEVQDQLMKAAQFGVPTKTQLAASYGYSPAAMMSMLTLENDVLGLTDKFEPLKSAHTDAGNNDGGRPPKSDKKLSDKGAKTKDTSANDNRAK